MSAATIKKLQERCQEIIDEGARLHPYIDKRFSLIYFTPETATSFYLYRYRGLPWYSRAWQRLTEPVTQIQTLYDAQNIVDSIAKNNPRHLKSVLEGVNRKLSWFSELYYTVKTTLHDLVHENEQERTQEFEDYASKAPSPQESVPKVKPPKAVHFAPLPFVNATAPSLLLTFRTKEACKVLGIDILKPVTWAVIRNAYTQMSRRYHPDKNDAADEVASTEQFKKINDAYKVLAGYESQLSPKEKVSKEQQRRDDLKYYRSVVAPRERKELREDIDSLKEQIVQSGKDLLAMRQEMEQTALQRYEAMRQEALQSQEAMWQEMRQEALQSQEAMWQEMEQKAMQSQEAMWQEVGQKAMQRQEAMQQQIDALIVAFQKSNIQIPALPIKKQVLSGTFFKNCVYQRQEEPCFESSKKQEHAATSAF